MTEPSVTLDLQQAARSAILSAPKAVLFQALSDMEALPSNVHSASGIMILRNMARRMIKDDAKRQAFLRCLSARIREYRGMPGVVQKC